MANNYMTNSRRTAQEIYKEMMDSFVAANNGKRLPKSVVELCKKVYNAGCTFLEESGIMNGGVELSRNQVVSMEDIASDDTDVSENKIDDLVNEADVPEDQTETAKEEVACLIAKLKACAGNNELFRSQHFSHGNEANLTTGIDRTATAVFAPTLRHMLSNIGIPSMEAFGANIDKVLPDIRSSLAVTLLQFHRGLLDRIIHRRTSASPYVKYVVPYAEVYDMLKSNDADHNVRDWGDHIVPFIELYGDPRVVSNVLQPIIPLKSNDTDGVLVADGFVKFNVSANLFDLSAIPNSLGRSHFNYTDLVSENVILNSVLIKVVSGGTTETFEVKVDQLPGARLQMYPNANDSGMRMCNLQFTNVFDATSKTVEGNTTTIFAGCTETDVIKYNLRVAATINLKRSDTEALGGISIKAYNRDGGAVDQAVSDLAAGLTVTLEGYSIDAKYSEENLRKSNLAIRSHVRTFDFEISNGRNILVDYSMNEEVPEFLMSLVTEATSLGQDHRGIDVIIRELLHVYDVTNQENKDPDLRERLDKVGFQYVAAQQVRPVVYLNTIDLANVDTIRSGDVLGDIRQYVEWELMNLVSLIYQNSFYKHQLQAGEKPTFKLFTSAVILENLFNVPHYHNHLNTEEAVDGTSIEYRRVLPNGTVLDCVTCTYNYMRDKIVMIPWRENMPEDILNFGHNWDFGTFVAHYNPQIDNAVNKRIFSNTRAMVIPTNPMGLYLDVRNLNQFIDMFQITNNTTSKLPQPSDLIVGE